MMSGFDEYLQIAFWEPLPKRLLLALVSLLIIVVFFRLVLKSLRSLHVQRFFDQRFDESHPTEPTD